MGIFFFAIGLCALLPAAGVGTIFWAAPRAAFG